MISGVSTTSQRFISAILKYRIMILLLFVVLVVIFLGKISDLKFDVSLQKQIPARHSFMQNYGKYAASFGGGNQVFIALVNTQGDIFNDHYFQTLEKLTQEVAAIPGVDQSRVSSLVTANVRFTEIVEQGFSGGTVFPADFQATEDMFQKVRANISKSEQAIRLVNKDFSASLVRAELVELDPITGKNLNYAHVADYLNHNIREKFQSDAFEIKIIGFAQLIGDIHNALHQVVQFFIVSLIAVYLLLLAFLRNALLAILPLVSALFAVIYLLGLLVFFEIDMHPFGIFVPFLIIAIGTSHGLQMVHAWRQQFTGATNIRYIEQVFAKLFLPGAIALISDCIGFVTILHIDIGVIRDMALAASLGVGLLILSNMLLLPVLLSFIQKVENNSSKANSSDFIWDYLSRLTRRSFASKVMLFVILIFIPALWMGGQVVTGDLQDGVPELREQSRYNQELKYFGQNFSRSMDLLVVYAEAKKDACINYEVMRSIDEYVWQMKELDEVLYVSALPLLAKNINVGWHEGSLKWFDLPRQAAALGETVSPVETTSGLLNHDCSVMPIYIYTTDHKSQSLQRVITRAGQLKNEFDTADVRFVLAGGSLAILAATNQVVDDAQLSILLTIFIAIILLCWFLFKSLKAVVCIVLPLVFVSVLSYALMTMIGIGLKISTLPVIALGVGIGVDYAIYLFHYLQQAYKNKHDIEQAFSDALHSGGRAVMYTGLTLSLSIIIWIFSPLKYQADMGLLLAFMFMVNMIAAIILLPALMSLIYQMPNKDKDKKSA